MVRLRQAILVPLLAATIVVALAACAPPYHRGGSPTHSSTHSAAPTSTPTPAGTRPALAELVLSTSGIGPIHLGELVPTTPPSLAIVTWNPTKCVSTDLGIAPGDPNAGAWQTIFPDESPDGQPIPPFILTTEGSTQAGNVNLVWAWTNDIHTAAGIRVGSSLDRLHTAYPAFTRTINGGLSDVYIIDGPTGSLSFEVSKQSTDGGGDYWPADQVGKVLWMGATATGGPIGPIAASDGGPSPCPTGA